MWPNWAGAQSIECGVKSRRLPTHVKSETREGEGEFLNTPSHMNDINHPLTGLKAVFDASETSEQQQFVETHTNFVAREYPDNHTEGTFESWSMKRKRDKPTLGVESSPFQRTGPKLGKRDLEGVDTRSETTIPKPMAKREGSPINEGRLPIKRDLEAEGFTCGYSEGFLAGRKYQLKCMQEPHNASGKMQSASPVEGPKVGSNRAPYRFCIKCFVVNKTWVLKSIKLPSGVVKHLHPEVCPVWDEDGEEPTKEQLRVYGAAFKRAQRSSKLHDVAFEAYQSWIPEVPESYLKAFLCLRAI